MRSCFCHFGGLLLAIQLLSAQGTQDPAPAKAEDFFRVIRENDLSALRALAAKADLATVRDGLGMTPLHYAATYGSTESIGILLDRGADPNARNSGDVTPLIYAGYNLEKTSLLIEKGADVNARARNGTTALIVAASVHNNAATVRYLLEKGADLKAARANGVDALQTAAWKGEAEVVRQLLAKGADPHHADNEDGTALMLSFTSVDVESPRLLAAAGADVNAANTSAGRVKNGPIALVHLTPLMFAAPDADPAAIAMLLKAGARVNETDIRKMTPLMLAVATDAAKPTNVRQLIGSGADVNAIDMYGDSVLDWALKYRQPEIVAALTKAGAKSNRPFSPPVHPADFKPAEPSEAIARASTLLAKSGEIYFKESGGCVGCHHQPLIARAYAAVRAAGLAPEERMRKMFLDGMIASRSRIVTNLPIMLNSGGDFDGPLYEILALADLGEPASPTTDAIVQYLAARQDATGAWNFASGPRTPLESSSISRTAAGVRAFRTYGWPGRQQEFQERIARARAWLLAAHSANSYEQADRLTGLRYAGASDDAVAAAGRVLIEGQRDDGGWSQNPYLGSDAFATSVALRALHDSGIVKASDPVYRNGVAYLLHNQFPDGSWYVRSRAPKLQPYFQSAFPYDHDQWISAAATAWSVMALAPAAVP